MKHGLVNRTFDCSIMSKFQLSTPNLVSVPAHSGINQGQHYTINTALSV